MPLITNVIQGRGGLLERAIWGTGKALWQGATGGTLTRTAFWGTAGGLAGLINTEANSPTGKLGAALSGATWGAILGGGTHLAYRAARAGWKANLRAGARAYEKNFIGPRLPGGAILSMGPLKRLDAARRAGHLRWSALRSSPGGSILQRYSRLYGRAGKRAGISLFKAGRFAFEHPLVVGGIAGGAIGAQGIMAYGGQPLASPTLSGVSMNPDYNQQAMAAEELGGGVSPMTMMGPAPQMVGRMQAGMMGSTTGLVQGLHNGRH